ncbi:MAG: peptidogalycan biosysnthesis protein [Agriterribacter sp.]
MKTEIYDDIKAIDPYTWDLLNPEAELFHTHRFLKALQKARVEDADMYFLVIKDGDRMVGTAVLSAFTINLDLFINVQSVTKLIKKMLPHIFKVRVLFCGTPVSAAHKNIQAMPYAATDVYKAVAEAMESIAAKAKANTLIFKELLPGDLQYADALLRQGYFRGYSIPSTWMPVKHDTYNNYLKSMRHNFRRQIIASLKKAGMELPVVSNNSSALFTAGKPVIRYVSWEEISGKEFYTYYLSVMSRAAVKLETLNEAFFENVFTALADKVKLIAFVHNGEIICVFAFTIYNRGLNFLWTGKKHDKDAFDSYHNLLNALVDIAIENRCEKLVLGQTSYYPKQRIGACTEDRFIYVRSRRSLIHSLLKKLNPWIFPYMKVSALNVFKKQPHVYKGETAGA